MLDPDDDADRAVVHALAAYLVAESHADADDVFTTLIELIRADRLGIEVRSRLDPNTLKADRYIAVIEADGTERHAPLDALGLPPDTFEW